LFPNDSKDVDGVEPTLLSALPVLATLAANAAPSGEEVKETSRRSPTANELSTMAEQMQVTAPQLGGQPTERRPSDDHMTIYLEGLNANCDSVSETPSDITPSTASSKEDIASLSDSLAVYDPGHTTENRAVTSAQRSVKDDSASSRRQSFSAGSKRPRAPSSTEAEFAGIAEHLEIAAAVSATASRSGLSGKKSDGTLRPFPQRRRQQCTEDKRKAAMPESASHKYMEPFPPSFSTLASGESVIHERPMISRGYASTPTAGERSLQWAPDVIRLAEHPAQQGRFRYAKEKRRTALVGRHARSVPTIEIAPSWRGRVPDGSQVTATVVSRHTNAHSGLPLPHWHRFDDSGQSQTVVSLKNGYAEFPSLVVIRGDRTAHEASCAAAASEGGTATAESPYSSDDQQIIRILFTVRFRDSKGGMILAHAISEPIYSSELKITEMSHHRVAMTNSTDIIILTSKIKKATTFIKITDPAPPGWVPEQSVPAVDTVLNKAPIISESWSLDKQNRPTCMIQPSYVHYQCSLSVQIPPYWDRQLQIPHTVEVRLVDSSQGLESSPVSLEYVPAKHLR